MASNNDNDTGFPGLLKGVDVRQKDWYSDDLSPSVELREDGHFYKAAEDDAELRNCTVRAYLDEMDMKMTRLMRDGDVFDRVQLKAEIRGKASKMGSLSFIKGSRSIGKTRLLAGIAAEYKDPDSEVMIVYVNGREGSVAKGIRKALNELKDKNWFESVNWTKIDNMVTKANPTAAVVDKGTVCGLSHLFELLKSTEDEDADLVNLMTVLAQETDKKPCLIIDEANRVAKAGVNTALLDRIIRLTKEKLNLSVMLCTSTNSYPGIIAENFNVEYATSSYVEEFSPAIMMDILTKEEKGVGKEKVLGMGPNLAHLCIASCGGNLTRVGTVIEKLRAKKERFTPLKHLYIRLEGKSEIVGLMEESEYQPVVIGLAKRGFWESTPKTRAVEKKLVEMGVASKVQAADLVEGSPFLDGYPDDFLVPSSQSLRAYIVETCSDQFQVKN